MFLEILRSNCSCNTKDVVFFDINYNSTRSKFDNLIQIINVNVDVLAVAEQKLGQSFPPVQFFCPLYNP